MISRVTVLGWGMALALVLGVGLAGAESPLPSAPATNVSPRTWGTAAVVWPVWGTDRSTAGCGLLDVLVLWTPLLFEEPPEEVNVADLLRDCMDDGAEDRDGGRGESSMGDTGRGAAVPQQGGALVLRPFPDPYPCAPLVKLLADLVDNETWFRQPLPSLPSGSPVSVSTLPAPRAGAKAGIAPGRAVELDLEGWMLLDDTDPIPPDFRTIGDEALRRPGP